MIKEYKYTFKELDIVAGDIEKLLGFKDGETPEPFPELIQKGLNEVSLHCNIRGGYKIFDSVQVNTADKTILLEDQIFSSAKVIVTQLKEATSAALFTCTAGKEISEFAQRISTEEDPMYGYILDVFGSTIVEKAMDKIQNELKVEVAKTGLSISDRYSPGYCEWSVNEQHKLFFLLPEKFCEITLSTSALMSPIKSVSGIIGIGATMQQKGYQCNWCNDKNCIYGRIKRKENHTNKT